MHKLSLDFNPNHTLDLSQRCFHTWAAFGFFQQPFPMEYRPCNMIIPFLDPLIAALRHQ